MFYVTITSNLHSCWWFVVSLFIYIGCIFESRIIIIPIASLLSPFLFIIFRRNYKNWFHVRNNPLRIRLGNTLLNINKNIYISKTK